MDPYPSNSYPPPTHTEDIDRAQARELGRERTALRRARVSRIRKRIIAASATTFVVAWAAIFYQLASGDDPALSNNAQASTVSTTASSTDSSGSSSSSSSSPSDDYNSDDSNSYGSNSGSSSTSSSQAPSPVTTQQS